MEIKSTYVTFEQAKILSNLGLDSKPFPKQYLIKTGEFSTDPIMDYYNQKTVAAPEQWQVIEWLHIKHGVQIFLDYTFYDGFHYGCKFVESSGDFGEIWKEGIDNDIDGCDTPQEAYSFTFDYILKKLIRT